MMLLMAIALQTMRQPSSSLLLFLFCFRICFVAIFQFVALFWNLCAQSRVGSVQKLMWVWFTLKLLVLLKNVKTNKNKLNDIVMLMKFELDTNFNMYFSRKIKRTYCKIMMIIPFIQLDKKYQSHLEWLRFTLSVDIDS